ncbi:MAG: hypothetical protein H8D32_05750 [Dehalococcoidia bacterium]|nr:hypothetical protein [Dehalococcoidia bacterium]
MVALEMIDLGESIPHVLVNGMRSGEANVVRGLQAMSGAIMWHPTHPAIHLIELIVDARSTDGVIHPGFLSEVMCSTRGNEVINDFTEWGFLEMQMDDELNEICVAPEIWDTFTNSLDESRPDMGLQSMGKLLGICSLAKNVANRRRVGIGFYSSVKALAVRCRNQGGKITPTAAKKVFSLACSGHERKWLDMVYGDKQKVESLRFFADMTGNDWVINPDVLVALERIVGRTNELLRERGITT